MLWRLLQDDGRWYEGSCISEGQYRGLHYLERGLYEPISDEERKDLIEVLEENYCDAFGLICVLFYTESEAKKFIQKLSNVRYLN